MQNNRIIKLLDILLKETDDEHKLTTNQLINKLAEEGVSVHRNTISSDIEILKEAGYDIICEKSTQNLYYIGKRDFDNAEIKMLCDAVNAAHFITEKQTSQLISKLLRNVSTYTADKIRSMIQAPSCVKVTESSIYNADLINQAISQKKAITFQYYEYNEQREKVLKHNGYIYTVSPYAAVWHEDRYYMIGYSVKHEDIANFRIDRMTNLSVSDKSKYVCQRDFDLKEYLQAKIKVFKGVRTEVCLKCKSKHMKAILDYFGHGIKTTNSEKGYFNAVVEIELSPTFYAWVFQFGGDIIIQSPQNAVDEFIKIANTLIQTHTNL